VTTTEPLAYIADFGDVLHHSVRGGVVTEGSLQ
jgi:hypothetical protein